jgi:hypothetical protein
VKSSTSSSVTIPNPLPEPKNLINHNQQALGNQTITNQSKTSEPHTHTSTHTQPKTKRKKRKKGEEQNGREEGFFLQYFLL